jgi:molybdopterin-guanine dinucleotide biosynthesis protein A
MRIFGVILAGGQGQRMGGVDKALVPLASAPLLAHVIARLEPQVERLVLSANGDAARFARFGLPVLPDGPGAGPLAGVLAALRWAAPLGATAVVSTPVDGPFLPGDLCPRLCLAAENAPEGLAVAQAGGRLHPTFALWPVELAEPLAAFLDSGAKPKVMDFVAAHGATEAHFAEGSGFDNLNTPEDLARAEAILRGSAG